MERSKIRKNPFDNPNNATVPDTSNNQSETVRNQNVNTIRQTNQPPSKGDGNKKQIQSNQTNTTNYNTQRNSSDELIMKEYESIKVFNCSKGYIRTTTMKYH
jgi:hypothetical protein